MKQSQHAHFPEQHCFFIELFSNCGHSLAIRHMHKPIVERGRSTVDTLCGNCGQTGHTSGSPKCPAKGMKCHFCQKPNHWEVVFWMKRQSQLVTESRSSSQTNHIVPPRAAKSSSPFMQTVQIITCTGRLVPFRAEVDTGSFCTIVDHHFLSMNLPNMLVMALRELSCTYDHSPIRALQGTVDIQACFADCAISTTIYVATSPCQPLIGHDLIDGLGLIIQVRGVSKPESPSSVTSPELPRQLSLILKV